MPMVRIGERWSAGLITQAQLDDALAQQKRPQHGAAGRAAGAHGVCRAQRPAGAALSRKMGYPLVDIDAFPVEADALSQDPPCRRRRSRLALMPAADPRGPADRRLDDPAPPRRRRGDRVHRADEGGAGAGQSPAPGRRRTRLREDRRGLQSGRSRRSDAAQPIEFALTDTDKLLAAGARQRTGASRSTRRRSSRATTRWCG